MLLKMRKIKTYKSFLEYNKVDESSILDVFRSHKGKVKSILKSLEFIDNCRLDVICSDSIITKIEFDDNKNRIYILINDSLNSLKSGIYIDYDKVSNVNINFMIDEYIKFYKEIWSDIMYMYDTLDYLFQPIYDMGCRYYDSFILDTFRKKLFIELDGDIHLISKSDEIKHISDRLLPSIKLDKIYPTVYPNPNRCIISYTYSL